MQTRSPHAPETPVTRVRVLIVDDSAFMRRVVRTALESDPRIEVVDTARNGREGLARAELLRPDVITLDIEMPEMDGLAALRAIRMRCRNPRPAVIMCSSLTSSGSHEVLQAMRLGAADVIAKDPKALGANQRAFRDELVAKVLALAPKTRPHGVSVAARRTAPNAGTTPVSPLPPVRAADWDLVVIGSSTGGPPVLEAVLCTLPADTRVPIVVAQHMPAMFTRSLAQRLDQYAAMSAVLAEDGMPLLPGTIYIGEGGLHTRIRRGVGRALALEVSREPAEALYHPSVNELFGSAARVCGSRTLGVMLTGMGEDGVHGARDLVAAGGRVIAQHERSCVVYGMPRAVVAAGLAWATLEPEGIAATLRRLSGGGGGGGGEAGEGVRAEGGNGAGEADAPVRTSRRKPA